MTHSCFKKLVYNVDDDRYTNLNNIECAGTENVKPEMDQTITSVFFSKRKYCPKFGVLG